MRTLSVVEIRMAEGATKTIIKELQIAVEKLFPVNKVKL
jgi:hypothetical protein